MFKYKKKTIAVHICQYLWNWMEKDKLDTDIGNCCTVVLFSISLGMFKELGQLPQWLVACVVWWNLAKKILSLIITDSKKKFQLELQKCYCYCLVKC